MKIYCRFLTWSTGYVPNSNPPVFEDKYIKPIAMLGSDGVMPLDGRKSLSNLITDCKSNCEKRKVSKPIGFEIVNGRIGDNGLVLYTDLFEDRPSKNKD